MAKSMRLCDLRDEGEKRREIGSHSVRSLADHLTRFISVLPHPLPGLERPPTLFAAPFCNM
jgi:hypothetical protein